MKALHRNEAIVAVHGHYEPTDRATTPALVLLPCQCWCGKHTLNVPQRLIKAGRTLSCSGTASQPCLGPNGESATGHPTRSTRATVGPKGIRSTTKEVA